MLLTEEIKVSIIMPAYNAEQSVRSSIDSVIRQSYKNWELLIVNDCSKDGTLAVIKEYEESDSRIKVFDLKGK